MGRHEVSWSMSLLSGRWADPFACSRGTSGAGSTARSSVWARACF